MEAAGPLVPFYQTTPHDIPEDSNPRSDYCENLKSHTQKKKNMLLKQSFIVKQKKETIVFRDEIIDLKLWISL
jgi:hypothetical protein